MNNNVILNSDEFEITARFHDGTNVHIYKNGGGTFGQTYTGQNWTYRVEDTTGNVIGEGDDLYMGSPATHLDAANAAHDFLVPDEF